MKHMKKVFCLFMAIAMTVSMLVGCGSSGSGEGSNDGATVKRFFREADHIRLQPENDEYEPIYTRDCQILGKVIGLYRRY